MLLLREGVVLLCARAQGVLGCCSQTLGLGGAVWRQGLGSVLAFQLRMSVIILAAPS